MKYLFFKIILCILWLTSCKDNSIIEIYHFNETQCANPWQSNLNGEDDDVTVIRNYLEQQSVDVQNVFIDSSGVGEDCQACVCLSGRIIMVHADNQSESILMDMGFYLE